MPLSLFGQDLSDDELEIIIESGIPQSQWDRLQRITDMYNRRQNQRTTRFQVIQALKAIGVVGSSAVAVLRIFNNKWQRATDYAGSLRKSTSTTQETPQKRPVQEVGISPEGQVIQRRRMPHRVPTRRFNEDIDMGEASNEGEVDNSRAMVPASAARSAGNSGRMGAGHGETPLIPQPVSRRKPWADTEQIVMTYFNVTGTVGVNDTTSLIKTWRLNSIYDVEKQNANYANEANLATADTADGAGSIQVPTWRQYYKDYYNYWSVVSSRYRLRFYATATGAATSSRNMELICYVYHHGAQVPPQYQTTGPNVHVPHQLRREHDGMYYFPIRFAPDASGSNLVADADKYSCSGTWTPGSIVHEVAEDELKQTWHKQTEVPPTLEGLTIIVQPSPLDQSPDNVDVRCEVTIEYTVQLKDLKYQYQYPTGVTAIAANTAPFAQATL